jgi:glutamate-5-semialdehyde dehydrogenase
MVSNISMDIISAAQKARAASLKLGTLNAQLKNSALKAITEVLIRHKDKIIAANKEDIARAENEKLASPLLKRLRFDETKLAEAVKGIAALIDIPDPVGKTLSALELDKGLELFKVSCPIGVIGVIFESRPDSLVQIASLALKSANAVLLKGGKEALKTNKVLADLIHDTTVAVGLPKNWLQLLETREEVKQILALDNYLDLIIPRGSNQFVKYIMDNTSIPVLGHASGICHVYLDEQLDPKMAVDIVVDSKCQYVAVCNALETLLVHHKVAAEILPALKKVLEEKQVELRGCPETLKFIPVKPAAESDWSTEYLDYILDIKTVDSLEQAVLHINTYGSHHTDAIVSSNKENACQFLNLVDSACVFWNCSTRFSDGYRFGLGAEVGISTNKIHARGPVGIEGLLIYKWKLVGKGHIVAPYTGANPRPFTHKKLNKIYSG